MSQDESISGVSASGPAVDEQRCISVIRGLAMDGPHAANSGHQGTAMALAPLAHVLYTRVMSYDAGDPGWADRDRFVLSCGHASILQYAMLHLTGFGLTLDDLKDFRQWGSATPGHPEVHHTAGIEVTTGPLGQGFANGVGLALAERFTRARVGSAICDHHTWVICSDGDLSEGISHEAASLAGHLGLGRLNCIYDDNRITIDGPTSLSLSDDAAERFRAYGWHVEDLGEIADDLDALEAALLSAKAVEDRPSMLIVRSHIGAPSPTLTDSPKAHGAPFGEEEISATKAVMGIPDEPFWVPDDVLDFYRAAGRRSSASRTEWAERVDTWSAAQPEQAAAHQAAAAGSGLEGWSESLPVFDLGSEIATRSALNDALLAVADQVPGILVGSADLTGSNGTDLETDPQSREHPGGAQMHFGIREHAMGALMNGAALHGGVIPVGGTFLVFSDYMRPAVRLAALSQAKSIFVWTHDSVGVGEDGPTHQPIEQTMSLRAIPDLRVIRPCDANEVSSALRIAINSDGPTALVLTRQKVPVLDGTAGVNLTHGAHAIVDPDGEPDLVLIGTGSEVQHCVAAAETLAERGLAVRVVSLACWELFDDAPETVRSALLGDRTPTISMEAGVTLGWARWADVTLGIDRYGASAPGSRVMAELGMTPEAIVDAATSLLDGDTP